MTIVETIFAFPRDFARKWENEKLKSFYQMQFYFRIFHWILMLLSSLQS